MTKLPDLPPPPRPNQGAEQATPSEIPDAETLKSLEAAFHNAIAELSDRRRFNQPLVSARRYFELPGGTVNVDTADQLARTQVAAVPLLLPAIEPKPVVLLFANWVDPKTISKEKDRSELNGWKANASRESLFSGLI